MIEMISRVNTKAAVSSEYAKTSRPGRPDRQGPLGRRGR